MVPPSVRHHWTSLASESSSLRPTVPVSRPFAGSIFQNVSRPEVSAEVFSCPKLSWFLIRGFVSGLIDEGLEASV